MTNQTYRFASGHTATLDASCAAILGYLRATTGIHLQLDHTMDWPERYQQLDAGRLDLAWICGGPYVRRGRAALSLLAAPVWQGERYADQPVYFADVIVRADHPARQLADLQGASWVYNEPGSLSGYDALRHHLHSLGHELSFFGRQSESGGHLASLQAVADGSVDVAAIDSVILELALHQQPALAERLRILTSIGPLPSMPWVIQPRIDAATQERLRTALVTMHETAHGRAVLADTPLLRFAPVSDADYAPIRTIVASRRSTRHESTVESLC